MLTTSEVLCNAHNEECKAYSLRGPHIHFKNIFVKISENIKTFIWIQTCSRERFVHLRRIWRCI